MSHGAVICLRHGTIISMRHSGTIYLQHGDAILMRHEIVPKIFSPPFRCNLASLYNGLIPPSQFARRLLRPLMKHT